jgi:hypothetical protein
VNVLKSENDTLPKALLESKPTVNKLIIKIYLAS